MSNRKGCQSVTPYVSSLLGALRYVFIFTAVMAAGTALADNSKFHGTFDMTMSGTEPHPWKEVGTLRIGSDQSRMREESYLHIPADGSPVTNAWTQEDGTPVSQVISISGDTITVDQREDCVDVTGTRFLCYTRHLEFAFADGHVGAAMSGSIWSQDPEENQGLITGSLTRVKDGGGGGGGCFIDAAIARDL
ncbi:MAG: hypothetical protein SWH78_08000 [Thermodesulfobacteriota bacterium]|nr:hypothetical protein [Thermodesulfobacteriota bacterium]